VVFGIACPTLPALLSDVALETKDWPQVAKLSRPAQLLSRRPQFDAG